MASLNFPFAKEITERVEPQDGQGIFVRCFMRQTSTDFASVRFVLMLIKSQIYPAKQEINNTIYNLLLLIVINIKLVEA